jgi:transcriptional regulator GlxA family with amidase domain
VEVAPSRLASDFSNLRVCLNWRRGIVSHLNQDLSVEALAAKACLCPRHFSRRFKAEFGNTPADFVERLRLDEARRRLSTGDNTVGNVAISLGFKSPDAFRRIFERRLGVNPSDYRRRFAATPMCYHKRIGGVDSTGSRLQ